MQKHLEPCNYSCYFCYAKYPDKKPLFIRDFDEVIPELSKLAGQVLNLASGPVIPKRIRLNFAGGEPFLPENALKEAISLGL